MTPMNTQMSVASGSLRSERGDCRVVSCCVGLERGKTISVRWLAHEGVVKICRDPYNDRRVGTTTHCSQSKRATMRSLLCCSRCHSPTMSQYGPTSLQARVMCVCVCMGQTPVRRVVVVRARPKYIAIYTQSLETNLTHLQ